MNRSVQYFATLLFVITVQSCFGQEADVDSGQDIEVRDVMIELLPDAAGRLIIGEANLGKLKVGQKTKLNLTVKNGSDHDVAYTETSKTCKCGQFESKDKVLPANQSIAAELVISSPWRQRSTTSNTWVTLLNRGRAVAQLRFDYELEGLLSFAEALKLERFGIDQSTKKIEIPVIVTAPLKFEDVDVTFSENLGSPEFETIADEYGGLITFELDQTVLGDRSEIRGEVYVRNPDSDQVDCCYLVLQNDQSFEISPHVIRFRNEGDLVTASAIIRFPEKSQVDAEKSVECYIQSMKLDSETAVIHNQLLKIKLKISKQMARDLRSLSESPELTWKIKYGETTAELNSTFTIEAE